MNDKTNSFGFVAPPSSASLVKVLAKSTSSQTPVVGRMVHLDSEMADGIYRAIGTVGNITTENNLMNDPIMLSSMVRDVMGNLQGVDMRSALINVQSVYRRDRTSQDWEQYGSQLPSSPGTRTLVHLLEPEDIREIIPNPEEVVYIGRFRGLDAPAPLVLPNFDSSRGAVHTGIIGRSGSGKTAGASFILAAQMKHENHAIIVVDPQGQWNSENGFVFSVKKFAAGLGRKVETLRVAEDIRLPLDENLLSKLMTQVNLWANFRRMGRENKEALSTEVASRITYLDGATDMSPKSLLMKVFKDIASSRSALDRIYAAGDRQEALKDDLLLMAGEEPEVLEIEGIADLDHAARIAEDMDDAERRIERILLKFAPIINLFASKNLSGANRRPLGGHRGFLEDVLQIRSTKPEIAAPYVILDMSSDVGNKAKTDYARSTRQSGEEDQQREMRRLLDDAEIKALIITTVLEELKAAAEDAFAAGGGNLNTQIVFDEAWRYAPNTTGAQRETPIGELSALLEGFALDTRKYGIGWTYILQSPSDLNKGIWRQLSFVYTGYGIQGSDKRMLAELMDEKDRDTQMGLYNQFASPASTGLYPFMVNGPVSPLIFTNTPTFVNIYTDLADFMRDNDFWIDEITAFRGRPIMTRNVEKLRLLPAPQKKKPTRSRPSVAFTPVAQRVVAPSTIAVASDDEWVPPSEPPAYEDDFAAGPEASVSDVKGHAVGGSAKSSARRSEPQVKPPVAVAVGEPTRSGSKVAEPDL